MYHDTAHSRETDDGLSAKWYSLIIDETTDLSKTEQTVLCLHHVDDDLNIHEELKGLHSLDSTSHEVLVSTNQDVLRHMDLTINNCCGQCYDSSINMSGA